MDPSRNGRGGKIWDLAKKQKMPVSTRAGVWFPVGRVHRQLKRHAKDRRVAATAAVYATACLDYLTAEVLELAGNVTHEQNSKRLTPRHLQQGIRGDPELDELVRVTIARSGEHSDFFDDDDEESAPEANPEEALGPDSDTTDGEEEYELELEPEPPKKKKKRSQKKRSQKKKGEKKKGEKNKE